MGERIRERKVEGKKKKLEKGVRKCGRERNRKKGGSEG